MAVPFGFSVGDFIAVIELIGTVIHSLEDSRGSAAEYRGVIAELDSLRTALEHVRDIKMGNDLEKAALRKVADQCGGTMVDFLGKIIKYQPALREDGSGRKWKDCVRKIQWSLYSKEDVRSFQAQVQGHTAAVQVLLCKIQMTSTSAAASYNNKALVRIESKMDQQKVLQCLVIHTISRCWNDVRTVMATILFCNLRLFDMITSAIQVSPQLEFGKPVTFEDAHGRMFPIHLQWVDSWDDFEDMLKIKFRKVPGLQKIESGQYALQDTWASSDLIRTQPFQACFRPGRRVNMSVIFYKTLDSRGNCPKCKTANNFSLGKEINCSGCGLWYQVREVELFFTKRRDAPSIVLSSIEVKTTSVPEATVEEQVSDFARVRIEDRIIRKSFASPCSRDFSKQAVGESVDLSMAHTKNSEEDDDGSMTIPLPDISPDLDHKPRAGEKKKAEYEALKEQRRHFEAITKDFDSQSGQIIEPAPRSKPLSHASSSLKTSYTSSFSSSTKQKRTILEKKKLEDKYLKEQRRRYESEIELIDMEARREKEVIHLLSSRPATVGQNIDNIAERQDAVDSGRLQKRQSGLDAARSSREAQEAQGRAQSGRTRLHRLNEDIEDDDGEEESSGSTSPSSRPPEGTSFDPLFGPSTDATARDGGLPFRNLSPPSESHTTVTNEIDLNADISEGFSLEGPVASNANPWLETVDNEGDTASETELLFGEIPETDIDLDYDTLDGDEYNSETDGSFDINAESRELEDLFDDDPLDGDEYDPEDLHNNPSLSHINVVPSTQRYDPIRGGFYETKPQSAASALPTPPSHDQVSTSPDFKDRPLGNSIYPQHGDTSSVLHEYNKWYQDIAPKINIYLNERPDLARPTAGRNFAPDAVNNAQEQLPSQPQQAMNTQHTNLSNRAISSKHASQSSQQINSDIIRIERDGLTEFETLTAWEREKLQSITDVIKNSLPSNPLHQDSGLNEPDDLSRSERTARDFTNSPPIGRKEDTTTTSDAWQDVAKGDFSGRYTQPWDFFSPQRPRRYYPIRPPRATSMSDDPNTSVYPQLGYYQ